MGGRNMDPLWDRTRRQTRATRESTNEWKKLGNQVSTVMTDMSRGIADLIFKGGKFKDIWVGVLKEVGKAFVRFFIEQGVNAAINGVLKLIGSTTRLATIFGGATKAASTVAETASTVATVGNTAANVGGKAAQTAGQVAGAAASGAMGMVGAIAGVATAVSSIIGNFQMAGMNKSLDLIEKATRYSESHLLQIVERGVNLFLATLPSIAELSKQNLDQHAWRIHDVWERLGEVVMLMKETRSQSNVTITLDGKVLAEAVVRQLRLAGA